MDVKTEELVEVFADADRELNAMLVNFEGYSKKFTATINSMGVELYETLESFRPYFVSEGLDIPEIQKSIFFDEHILDYHNEKNESFVRQIEEYQAKFKNLHDKIFDGTAVDGKDIPEESTQDAVKLFSEFQEFLQEVGQIMNDQYSLKNMRLEQGSKDHRQRAVDLACAKIHQPKRPASIPAAFLRKK